jgi:serine O-acetyltransferase
MSVWRADLMANANRTGLSGAVIGWFLNPGFAVITLYRVSRWGLRRGGKAGRLISALAWRRIVRGYGCYIDPAAVIGPGARLPHPVGIVVGEGTVIGAKAVIYQNVTFGRRNAAAASYPQLDDGVTVYAGAVLLGSIRVGEGAVIGAQALIRDDVPAGGLGAASAGTIFGPRC